MKKQIVLVLVLGILAFAPWVPAAIAGPAPVPWSHGAPVLVREPTIIGRTWTQQFPGVATSSRCATWYQSIRAGITYTYWRFHERFQVCFHYINLYNVRIDSWSDGTWASDVKPGWDYQGIVNAWSSGGVGAEYVKEFRQAKFCTVVPYSCFVSDYPWIWQGLWGNYDSHGPQYHQAKGGL